MSDTAPTTVQELARLAPEGLSGTGERLLDLDRHLSAGEGAAPPLAFGEGEFDLICSLRSFSELEESWEPWLLEVERLLAEGGVFVAALTSGAIRGAGEPPREWISLRKVGATLRREGGPGGALGSFLAGLDAGHRRRIDSLREGFHRELMRKSQRIAELEPSEPATPASWVIAERVAASYESTLSWRVTGPIRAAKRMLGRR